MRQSGVASLGGCLGHRVWTHDHYLALARIVSDYFSQDVSKSPLLLALSAHLPFPSSHCRDDNVPTNTAPAPTCSLTPYPRALWMGKVGNTCNKDDVEELMIFCVGFGYVGLTNPPVLCASP